MSKAWSSITDSDCRVSFVNDLLLECLDSCVVFPIVNNIHITLTTHVYVTVLGPVSACLTDFLQKGRYSRRTPKWFQEDEVLVVHWKSHCMLHTIEFHENFSFRCEFPIASRPPILVLYDTSRLQNNVTICGLTIMLPVPMAFNVRISLSSLLDKITFKRGNWWWVSHWLD